MATSGYRHEFSSDELPESHPAEAAEHLREYFADLRRRHSPDDVCRYLADAGRLKVLVVGETIIDEYVYCETMGKSGKEPILAARYVSTERFAGGALAVANQVAAAAGNVTLLTLLGDQDSHEDFIREQLSAGVDFEPLTMRDAPTIVKRRFVEIYPLQKLFEVYVMNGDERAPEEEEALLRELERLLPLHDVVVVADYGHGMLGTEAIELICSQAGFLAINVQTNAGNRGFNTVSKYPRADFVCVSEGEIRLEARSRSLDLREIAEAVARRMECSRMLITRGRSGAVCYGEGELHESPSLTSHIVDRVGAGDAVLSLTALWAAQGAPPEVIALVGNTVGARAVAIMGNYSVVDPTDVVADIGSFLK